MTTTSDATAHGYGLRLCEGYEADAKAHALLREHEGSTQQDLRDELLASEVEPVEAAIDAARELLELPPLEDGDTDVADGLDDWRILGDPLEIRKEGHANGYGTDWEIDRIRVTVTFGGPNAFLFYDGDRAWIECYWGGESWDGPIFDDDAVALIAADLEGWMYG